VLYAVAQKGSLPYPKKMKKHDELVLLGESIRRFRKKAGYTQASFARNVKLGRPFYGRIERGESGPGPLILIKIAKALNLEVGDLFPTIKEFTSGHLAEG
jgi:transcriptional regulator with XRE-family HTH domain